MNLDVRMFRAGRFVSGILVCLFILGCEGDQAGTHHAGSGYDQNSMGEHMGEPADSRPNQDRAPGPGDPQLSPQYGEYGEGGAAGAAGEPDSAAPSTNIALGGAQDFGYFRRVVESGQVPQSDDFDAAGFFAEHHTPLPPADCGERICIQGLLGVMANLVNGNDCTLLQIGLNSPIQADPDNRPPLDLVVVVDTSGSMRANGKLDFVREGLHLLVNELSDGDRMALVTYSSDVALNLDMTSMMGNRNRVHELVDRLAPGGGTNIHAGLEAGYQVALRHYDSGRQSRLILLSDGRATNGITATEQIVALSRDYNSEGIGLTTVGLGRSFNFELMRSLAEQGDGNFYFLENASAVEEVFTEELSYFTQPVAFDVELNLTPSDDYRIVRAYGSSFFDVTDEGTGRLQVPSVFLSHRESHNDVGEEGTRRGGGSALLVEMMPVDRPEPLQGAGPVGELELTFRTPGTDEVIQQRRDVIYPHGPGILLQQGFFDNDIVEKNFVVLNIYVALALACDSFHFERDLGGAVAILQMVRAAAADYEDSANDGEGDVDIQYDIELIDRLIEVMISQGAEPTPEEDLPDDPWPAD